MLRLIHAISLCACVLLFNAVALADTVSLKTSTRLPTGARVATLADVATLQGPEALRLADVEVLHLKADDAVGEVTITDVRKALDAAGANWAKVNLSGRSVTVRASRDTVAPPQAMTAAEITQPDSLTLDDPDSESARKVTLDAIAEEQSIRGSIARLIVANLRIEPHVMRVHFAPSDDELLVTPLSAGRFELQPLGSLEGDRLEFSVRRWQGSRTVHAGQVRLRAERLVNVTLAARDLTRDHLLVEEDLETTQTWLPQTEATIAASRIAAVGRVLERSLKAGDVIRTRDLQRQTLIKRGDLVTVRCLVGGVAISLKAEARADGSEGDAIEFRKSGERDNFVATVTGPNEAVVDLSRN